MAILFATSAAYPDLTADDLLAVAALREREVKVEPLVWSRSTPAALREARLVVIRSCWDYHLDPVGFGEWIDGLAGTGTRVVNGPGLLRWNLHKGYLLELEASGVTIVPTRMVARGSGATLEEVLTDAGWSEAVVKPAISLSAHATWRTSSTGKDADEEAFASLLAGGDVLVQAFVPEVMRGGEWSLVFLGGEYSHSVRKRPRAGDFRVQSEHGGTRSAVPAPPAIVEDAMRVMEALPEPTSYARVDGIEVGGRLVLMEVECIDPVLFLADSTPAAGRFAAELVARTRDGGG